MKIILALHKFSFIANFIGCALFFFFLSGSLYSQSYKWSGVANNQNFFDELNWVSVNSTAVPAAGTINPNQAINFNLFVNCDVNASGQIILANNKTLHIENGSLNGTRISGGTIHIAENGYLNLTGTTPLNTSNTTLNFTSPLAWLKLTNIKPEAYQTSYLSITTVNQTEAVYPTSIRIDNYYDLGSLVRINSVQALPMQIFDSNNLQGNSVFLHIDQIFSGNAIPANMNNNIRSFILKRSFMAVLADNEEGTGKSKVFIASENDLVVNSMPTFLSNNTSFIRIIPWNWVTKKGTGGDINGMDNSWYYKWSNNGQSDINREFAPMAWGGGAANDNADIEIYKSKYKATHVLSFNEADDCNGQSGQYGNLCTPSVAVNLHKNLMKTGLRIVSPSCREGAWATWLDDFNDLAVPADIRFDVVGIHWYDWGGNPVNTPNASATTIFNRFKAHLTSIHNFYNLPIWITEFNANPYRNTTVQYEFMQLALPYLESLDYVERYAWFQPSSGTGDFYDPNGNLTTIGNYYKNFVSTPSVSSNVYASPSNLDANNVGNVYTISCANILLSNDYTDNESTNHTLSIYPNPVKDYLYINAKELLSNVMVYDANGRIMDCKLHDNSINVSALKTGFYVVKINNITIKFIKE